jgi:hypothetical protein
MLGLEGPIIQNRCKLPSLIAELSPEASKTSKKGIMDFEDADTTGGDEDLPPTTTEDEDQILRNICSLLEEEEDLAVVVNPQTPWLMASC